MLGRRWLDTRTGVWLSEDPLGAVDSVNLYSFVGWQPSMGTDPMGTDTFVVRYGDAEMEADVYVSVQFLRARQDEEMTDKRFSEVIGAYRRAAIETWKELDPQIIVGRPAYINSIKQHGDIAYEYPNDQPFVSQVAMLSESGTSASVLIMTANATSKTYAHEFGHLLGLEDFYKVAFIENESGGITIQPVADTAKFGARATESIMGGYGTESTLPSPDDLRDILSSDRTKFELDQKRGPVHHLDISSSDVSRAVSFLAGVASARGIDITPQLEMLQAKKTAAGRRRVVEWTFGILFGQLPH